MNEPKTAAAPAEGAGEPAEKSPRYVVLIGDGMADYPEAVLGGKTALEAARTPTLDTLARLGEMGLVTTIPEGMPPGSDVANMSLLGYDPERHYTGRGPLEAAAMGVALNPEDVAFRCNLVTLGFREGRVVMQDYSAGHITDDEARELVTGLAPLVSGRSFELRPGVSYRHLLVWRGGPEGLDTVPPHDVTGQDVTEAWYAYEEEPLLYELLTKAVTYFHRHEVNERRRREGKPPANALWPWGQGRRPRIAPLRDLYGVEGAVVAAVDLIKGLGAWAGLQGISVPGATGWIDTNVRGKAQAALEAAREKDLVVVHLEAPDEAGHMGDAKAKVRAIERFDKELVLPVLEGLKDLGAPFRLLVVTDHFTPVRLRTHAPGPVPFVLYDSLNPAEHQGAAFTEAEAAKTGIRLEAGHHLLPRLLGRPPADADPSPKKR
ncbi:cofactor-independent phosphoglycerate mutase [Dissulfurirhabdus thermomarina]|uniref:Cofactor-independent phosphoglycerate mutase n=1 Tax=Dissulfurirhabdus thermomarina TaxID=1765737 RepID=A0A6N9TQX8_DISTH|nr:cofactor-independent phosphoglycerate mutase [Dissulfurirhabdus thermomarina]NDY41847.1 cofactor-independent phosphoglycerate mutase [Dissulfurirhabdus thermomarina]NMX22995.1 cofactor-independent phosphoglycerate mutase [Dissulfurirhabdus thermomarina]